MFQNTVNDLASQYIICPQLSQTVKFLMCPLSDFMSTRAQFLMSEEV